ncbi:MAG: outer membrane beta-barrel protein [Acidobacteria bacterium]|nr:outer membrane beta-barrel protein [Acidobacteriota bacterium]
MASSCDSCTHRGPNELFRGTALDFALNRRGASVEAGVAVDLTPFTTVVVSGRKNRDKFVSDPRRNSHSQSAVAEFSFARDAIVQGRASLGYRDFRPDSPMVARFTGFTSGAGLSFMGFWNGRFEFDASRDVAYSYDVDEGYYIGTTALATYTQRVVGAIDAQARLGHGLMDYGMRLGPGPRQDRTSTYAGGVGFNRTDGGRIGLTYEYEVRHSDTLVDRRYTTRRLYGSYTYTVSR